MQKTVKILSLVPYKFLPPDMGGQKGIAFFNRYLAKKADLLCVTVKENDKTEDEGYPVRNILSNSKLRYINLFYFFTLSRIVKNNSITHLIIEHPYYGWLGSLLKWYCKINLIVHSHNIESLRFKTLNKWWWGVLWHYEMFTHRNADLNFFIHDEDRNYAIENFKLAPGKCITITYGFEHDGPPSAIEKESARAFICRHHNIDPAEKILLFNGTLCYRPNLDALDTLLQKINPVLLLKEGFCYKIIICGNKLPVDYSGLINFKDRNIIYAGFVKDINLYFKGADIFINPVTDGGGIKTKIIEALGYGLSVISTKSGATGIPAETAGEKLLIIDDQDWNAFTTGIFALKTDTLTPLAFYKNFYWGNVVNKAVSMIG